MKRALLILGLASLGAAWASPLPSLAGGAFAAHMTTHMIVVAIAAPLIAAGLARSKFDPVRRWPGLFPPLPISLVELVVVWTWHAPWFHHMARHTAAGAVIEQATFFIAGLLIWLSVLGGDAQGSHSRAAAGVIALLLTSMHMTLLGALLALTPRPLYVHAGAGHTLSALDDQQLGGAIMILIGAVSYLAGGLKLTAELLFNRRINARA